jgi:hypothetical protein
MYIAINLYVPTNIIPCNIKMYDLSVEMIECVHGHGLICNRKYYFHCLFIFSYKCYVITLTKA